MSYFSHPSIPRTVCVKLSSAIIATIFFVTVNSVAQNSRSVQTTFVVEPHEEVAAVPVALDLPDAPGLHVSSSAEAATTVEESQSNATTGRVPRFAPAPTAPLYNKYIEPGQKAQPLKGFERKLAFGADQIVSPYFLVSVISSAGYDHVVNGRPNYGTDKGAFGARLGADAISNVSQSIFTDGLMPAVFHQDPRYYVMGRGHSLLVRGRYAISRVFVTRTDSGESAPNYSLFAGHAATVGLQNAYYPDPNRGASETLKAFATSFAGSALSNGIRELYPDLLHLIHLE